MPPPPGVNLKADSLAGGFRARRPTRVKTQSMSTLLLTPSRLPRSPQPARPSRAAGPPARHRAGAGGGALPACWRASRRRPAPLEIIALCHPMDYVEAIRDATPAEGLVRLDADTSMSPGSFEAALARRRRRHARGRRGDEPEGGQRLRRHASARPSRRDGAADGLLPVQQRRDRGALRAGPLRASSARRSSISTCITATARRIFSGPTRA